MSDFVIINNQSKKVLEVNLPEINNNGGKVQQWDYIGAPNQIWSLEKIDQDWFSLRNKQSGKALDVPAPQGNVNGTPLQQWDYNGGQNQQWKKDGTGGEWYCLKNQMSGKALDAVMQSINDNGGVIIQWDPHCGTNQQWSLKEIIEAPDALRGALAGLLRELSANELSGKVFENEEKKTKKVAGIPVKHEAKVSLEFEDPKVNLNLVIPRLVARAYDNVILRLSIQAPVKGQVGYKIVNVLNTSSNLKAEAHINATAQILINLNAASLAAQPQLTDLDGGISNLWLANDIADAISGFIEDAANNAIKNNIDKVAGQINEAIKKAAAEGRFKLSLEDIYKLIT